MKKSCLVLLLVLFLISVKMTFALPPPPDTPSLPSQGDVGDETPSDAEEAETPTDVEEGMSNTLLIFAIVVAVILIFIIIFYLARKKVASK